MHCSSCNRREPKDIPVGDPLPSPTAESNQPPGDCTFRNDDRKTAASSFRRSLDCDIRIRSCSCRCVACAFHTA